MSFFQSSVAVVKKIFPDRQVLPVMGNHDSFPCNRLVKKLLLLLLLYFNFPLMVSSEEFLYHCSRGKVVSVTASRTRDRWF
jgi:hypothetical protein